MVRERESPTELVARGRRLPLGERTLVMGIVNVSPDSFSGDGVADTETAVEQARRFLEAGADLLDVGAMSTRPGATPIPEELEARRLSEVVGAVRPLTEAPISADAYRVLPARAALEAGADILNDVTGLRDARMAPLAAEYGAGVVVMHMQGMPDTMQLDPRYEDVVGEVYEYLASGAARAEAAGVAREGIIVDPGIGFGKTLEHNLELLRRLGEFRGLGLPLLVGTSRKGFIGRVTGREVGDRVEGTAATVALAIANGAEIVRVHDVDRMMPVVRMSDAIVRRGQPSGAVVAR
jgi:dihydropteroate synthase